MYTYQGKNVYLNNFSYIHVCTFCIVTSGTTLSQPVLSAGISSAIMTQSKLHIISYYTVDNNCITLLEPLMVDLQKIVIPKIMTKWEELAEALNFDSELIEAIKQKEREDPKKCYRQFFKDWLGTGYGTNPKT